MAKFAKGGIIPQGDARFMPDVGEMIVPPVKVEGMLVDLVLVVRCKDFEKGFEKKQKSKLSFVWCAKWRNIMRPCDFCSYGERRTDGK